MLLVKNNNFVASFSSMIANNASKIISRTIAGLLVLFLFVVVWNLNYMSNMSDMSRAIIDSYLNTGDKMGQEVYKSIVDFEKNNFFSPGFFGFFTIAMTLFFCGGLLSWLATSERLKRNEILAYSCFGLALACSWFGIFKFAGTSRVEQANAYVHQSTVTKTASIESFYEPTCYSHKQGRSCTQKMAVNIEGQRHELTTSNVDFYKVGQELEVKYEIYRTNLTHERKVNIVY